LVERGKDRSPLEKYKQNTEDDEDEMGDVESFGDAATHKYDEIEEDVCNFPFLKKQSHLVSLGNIEHRFWTNHSSRGRSSHPLHCRYHRKPKGQ